MGIIFANLAIFGTSPIANELFIIIDNGNAREGVWLRTVWRCARMADFVPA